MVDNATLNFGLITRQQRQVLNDISSMRDDLTVMMALLQRRERMLAAVLPELRVIHSQHSRVVNCTRALEERAT